MAPPSPRERLVGWVRDGLATVVTLALFVGAPYLMAWDPATGSLIGVLSAIAVYGSLLALAGGALIAIEAPHATARRSRLSVVMAPAVASLQPPHAAPCAAVAASQ